MILNPTLKVLSSIQKHKVRALLMGGQACVLYGAAEFSRDADLAILANTANLARLKKALDDLQAEVIEVPPFELAYLQKGHAVHFRCHHPDAGGLRVDVMSKMHNVAPFSALWKRRAIVQFPGGTRGDLLSLFDLVQAKKTQRDKDWPMVRRLVEGDYFSNRSGAAPQRIRFWFLELRTPELLAELAARQSEACRKVVPVRPLLEFAFENDLPRLDAALQAEEAAIRETDRRYWEPLRHELEQLRHQRARRT